MNVIKEEFEGNTNIGLFAINAPKTLFIGSKIDEKKILSLEKKIKKPIKKLSINNSSLIGVFVRVFEDIALVPSSIKLDEEKELINSGLRLIKIDSKLNCLGNNILFNKKAAVVSEEYDDISLKPLKDFGLEVIKMNINNEPPGSVAIINNNKGLITPFASDEEKERLEEIFSISFDSATINFGSPYLYSGIILDNNFLIMGSNTTGPELVHIDQYFSS